MVFCSTYRGPVARVSRARVGFTLLELIVVMALVAVFTAAVAPSIVFRTPSDPTLPEVVAAGRAAAVARAQSLRLVVRPAGDWDLRLPLPADSAIARGIVAALSRPSGVVDLRLSPLGTCVAVHPLPETLAGWDAARCTSAATGPQ